uniref:NADH dehydrogenase [ubiquinone] 1 alpha subcomplex subunit 5 n=1 Tax=Romanomermis culicivorax TaxID=13658 RepID=A0A915I4M8_ROMCU
MATCQQQGAQHNNHKNDSGTNQLFGLTTGLTGLWVSKFPHEELKATYNLLNKVLATMPKDAAYRVNTEKIINERCNLILSEPDVEKLEDKIGMGQIEEVLEQARHELELARTMAKYRPWEPLVSREPEGQYAWPI